MGKPKSQVALLIHGMAAAIAGGRGLVFLTEGATMVGAISVAVAGVLAIFLPFTAQKAANDEFELQFPERDINNMREQLRKVQEGLNKYAKGHSKEIAADKTAFELFNTINDSLRRLRDTLAKEKILPSVQQEIVTELENLKEKLKQFEKFKKQKR